MNNAALSRRNLIQYGGGFLGTSLMATVIGSQLGKSQPAVAQDIIVQSKDITPDQALTKLMAGNARFVAQKRITPNQAKERLVEVAEGQAPFAALLSCADSRVPAEIVFDQGLGDLFVCRVAGNIATSEQIGSLEFGTAVLGAKLIVVMGHTACGAVKATIEGGRLPGQIGSIIDNIQVGVERARNNPGADKLATAVKANASYQVELLKRSTLLGDLIDKKQLKIVAAYYDLNTGKVEILS
jgi:carbonic anhydrase